MGDVGESLMKGLLGDTGLGEVADLLKSLDESIRWLAHAVDENTDYMKRRDAYPIPPKVE